MLIKHEDWKFWYQHVAHDSFEGKAISRLTDSSNKRKLAMVSAAVATTAFSGWTVLVESKSLTSLRWTRILFVSYPQLIKSRLAHWVAFLFLRNKLRLSMLCLRERRRSIVWRQRMTRRMWEIGVANFLQSFFADLEVCTNFSRMLARACRDAPRKKRTVFNTGFHC